MLPLTAELLSKRTVVLFTLAEAASGPVEEILFDVLTCDGCGATVNLLEGFPEGWSTEGDFERGWRDLCEECAGG